MILLRILDRLEEILIATLMALATTLIFLAVCHRYLLGVPFLFPILFPINLAWAQELCIYMFVWVAKFGAAYGVRTGIHVGVDAYVQNWVEAAAGVGLPQVDGIAELHFPSVQVLERDFYNSAEGQEEIRQDVGRFTKGAITLCAHARHIKP